jgi:hypothetical protein
LYARYEELIGKLAEHGKISAEDYGGALTDCVEFLPDLALDAPSASNRFGSAVGAGLANNLCSHEIFDSEFFELLNTRSTTTVFVEVICALFPLAHSPMSITRMLSVFQCICESVLYKVVHFRKTGERRHSPHLHAS